MKIQPETFPRRNERGMATFVFITLLAIMAILVIANGHALVRLHRETKLLEQQQIKRLGASPTNSIAATKLESK